MWIGYRDAINTPVLRAKRLAPSLLAFIDVTRVWRADNKIDGCSVSSLCQFFSCLSLSLFLSDAKDLSEILEVRIVAFAFVDFISNAIRRRISMLDCGT